MMDFITTHATPLCWTLGIIWACGLVVIWSCLAMSKKCEVGDE